jgi:osmoprotectant transport system permease protein
VEQEEGHAVIDFLGDVFAYLADPANWSGSRGLGARLWQHIAISLLSLAFAAIVALPPAVILGHRRAGGFLAVSAVNLGRAIPSFGIVGVMFPITLSIAILASPIGYWATFIALVLLAMPPMFVNTYTGVSGIDDDLLEAARGMGMTERDVLVHVEVPLSMPLTMAGIRTAAVAVIATATLGAVVGFGGLGRPIIDGFAQGNDVLVFVGGLLVAVLAIAAELGLGWVEGRTDPSRRHSRRHRGGGGGAEPIEVADLSL